MQKLFDFQTKISAIKKDSENPHFGNRYFDINTLIETIKPVLNQLGLIIIQPIKYFDGKVGINTMVINKDDGNTIVESFLPLPELADPQKMGGAITYYRRYALQSLLLLEAEDDDGNTASGVTNSYYRPNNFSSQIAQKGMAQEQLGGTCKDCGGKLVKYQSGKVGCANKCWAPENAHLRNKGELPTIQVEDELSDQAIADIFQG